MSERTKKIVFAIVFVVLSIGMGYGLYRLFFGQAPGAVTPGGGAPGVTGQLPGAGVGGPPTGAGATGTGELPGAGIVPGDLTEDITQRETPDYGERVTLLHNGVTQAVAPSPDGEGARYYNPEDGRFYRVNADGTITALSDRQFFNVQDVQWGNRSDEAILEFPDGANIMYDFETKQQVTLPKHWEEFEFAPDDIQVASKSIGTDEANRFLILSAPDGGEARAIQPLGKNADRVHVSWSPNQQIVAYTETGELRGNAEQEIYFLGQNQENYRSLIAPGQGFLPNWSPAGKQILFSVWSPDTENRPTLWLAAGEPASMGKNRRRLNLNTWADKCVWASETELYCGVPQSLPANAGMRRENYATALDDLYRINLTTGVSVKINTPNQNRPIRQPVLNKDQSKLIFTDAETGRLLSYDLP